MALERTPSLLLLALFSYLFLLVAGSVEYQTLVVSPLQKPQTFHLDDEYFNWSAEEDKVGDKEASLRLRVAHRDWLHSADRTPEGLLRLRLERDAARVARLESKVGGAPNATRPGRGRGHGRGFSSPVVSGLAQGSGEYFTRVGVGSPPSYAYMVLDTGSDVVWVQCSPCRRCYPQADPVFDPRRSSSFAAIPCAAPLCRSLDASGCNARRRSCLYQVSYGDGSFTTGDFSTETLTFPGGGGVPRVALGCGHDNEGLFVAAAGLLGLGRGSLSFPSQAGRRFGQRFSYCLVDRTSSSSAANSSRSSTVVFGAGAVPRGSAAVSYTPMLHNPKMDTFYYVELTGVSVGGSRVAGVSASDLRLDPATGRGGVIVDSGTSVTRLARPAYLALRDAFRAGTAGLRASPGGFSLFDTCYDLSGLREVKVPTVVMHLAGGGDVSLPAENYLIPVDTSGTFCFAFAGTDSGVSIVGNIQQQGFRVVFDGARSRVGFVPRSC